MKNIRLMLDICLKNVLQSQAIEKPTRHTGAELIRAKAHNLKFHNQPGAGIAGQTQENERQQNTETHRTEHERQTAEQLHTDQDTKEEKRMPQSVDLEHLEENITGEFFAFLEKGGVEVNNIDSLAKIKHNVFESALLAVQIKLFRADKPGPNNQKSLLPYTDNLEILDQLTDIYIRLCTMCNKSTGMDGFAALTGYSYQVLGLWKEDELNPERLKILKKIVHNRKHIHINRLQDTPIGDVAVANNDQELGLNWAKNSAPQTNTVTAYILPGEAARQALEQRMAGALPKKDREEAHVINE